MTVVQSRILDPAGHPLGGRRVTAELIASAAFLDDRTGQILAPVETTTDTNGYWSLDLTPTPDLEASDAYYLVREYPIIGGFPVPTVITVPDDTETRLLRDLLAEVPSSPGWTPFRALGDLVDVDLSGAVPGQALVFHAGGLWAPGTVIGGGGSSAPVRHDQLVAATVWPVVHNLGYYPPAVSLHSADLSQSYDAFIVQHIDVDNLRVAIEIPTAGVALVR